MTHAEALKQIHLLDHPLAKVDMTLLRDRTTQRMEFRQALRRLSAALTWHALRDVPTRQVTIETPLETCGGHELDCTLVLVPILRAGLGFCEAMLDVLPGAEVGHVGLARDEETHLPKQYYQKLPTALADKEVLVLDPMLATGHSAAAALHVLKQAGARRLRFVGLLGCPEGIAKLQESHPEVPIYLAALDDGLDANCYIVPGLGDAGDRYFGT